MAESISNVSSHGGGLHHWHADATTEVPSNVARSLATLRLVKC